MGGEQTKVKKKKSRHRTAEETGEGRNKKKRRGENEEINTKLLKKVRTHQWSKSRQENIQPEKRSEHEYRTTSEIS